ncbi:hypothetical protein D3C85_1162310 [compost metagenome]
MPAIVRLAVEEQAVEATTTGLPLLFEGDGEGEVGGAEAYADHIVGLVGGESLGHSRVLC